MLNIIEIRSAIIDGQYTNDDLDTIQQAVTFARSQLARQNTGKFTKVSTVKFTSNRNGQRYNGIVEKVNIKNIVVRTTMGLYKVPANMLEWA